MRRNFTIFQNRTVIGSIIALLTILQIVRLVNFVSIYGGVEHDSGWVLGTARTLAETGTYASMVSTIVDPSPGGHMAIHERFKIQDKIGRIFFAPDSIGPSTVIPNALIIKIFGADFWQYRMGSLLYFTVALLLSAYLLYQVGGVFSIVWVHLFLFFYPHLIIYLGYEALGEIYGLVYLLLAFLFFNRGLCGEKYRWLWLLGCGLAAGLVLTSKLVGLLALTGLFLASGLNYWEKRLSLKELFLIGFGFLLPLFLWELYQFLWITLSFDFYTYTSFKDQIWQYFVTGGSGINERSSKSLAFMGEKFLVIKEISSPIALISSIIFFIILLGGPFLISCFYRKIIQRNIIIFFWVGWFTTSVWFIFLSQNGWVRHNWYALIFSIFLVSLLVTYFWQHFNRPPRWLNRVGAFAITVVILAGFIGQINAPNFFTPQNVVEQMYQKRLSANHSRIPWVIIPRDQQEAALAVIQRLPPSAHLFYPEGFKSAEIATLSGRIIYSIDRRPVVGETPHDVVIVGPDLISPWAKPLEKSMTQEEREIIVASVEQRITQKCPQIIFQNDYYLICALD